MVMFIEELEDSRSPELFHKAGRSLKCALGVAENALTKSRIASGCYTKVPDTPSL